MDTRHQVFVSSTYDDLKEERQHVIQTLLACDCIPAGMELFPASDDTQWKVIQRVIDDCDYYLVIVGGRYGSIGSDGVGYTEKEYDYAVATDKPVIGFVHGDPGSIVRKKTDDSDDKRTKLQAFLEKVKSRTVNHWTNPTDLAAKVALSITTLKKTHPRPGWIKAGSAIAPEEHLRLHQELEVLRKEKSVSTAPPPEAANFAQGEDRVTFSFRAKFDSTPDRINQSFDTTWNNVLRWIGPHLLSPYSETDVLEVLANQVEAEAINPAHIRDSYQFPMSNVNLVKVQFIALGLIDVKLSTSNSGYIKPHWSLTANGQQQLMQVMAIRRQ